jgi:hypothetical protein
MLAHVRDSLAQVHPDFPWVFLATAIWLVQYLLRRFSPKVWVVAFSWMPTDLPVLAQRVLQGLPSALIGAAIPALASGGDATEAVKGALFGALAPLWHHMLKAMPGPYSGGLAPAKAPADPPDPAS